MPGNATCNQATRNQSQGQWMSVAYVATHAFPSPETDTEQAIRTVDALWSLGLPIDLIMPRRLIPKGNSAATVLRSFYGIIGGFGIHTYRGGPQLPLEVERLFAVVSACFNYLWRYDLVHTRSRGTCLVCAVLGQPVVFETYRDLRANAPLFLRALKLAAGSRSLRGIVCHSDYAARALVDAGIDAGKVAVVYNGFDPDLLEPRLTRKQARAQLGWPQQRPVAIYVGNVQPNKGLDSVLDLAKALPKVTFVIVGGQVAHLRRLSREITLRALENVELTGWKPHAEIGPYLYAADILLIPPTSRPLEHYGRTVLPMKTFVYLGAGRPILAAASSDIEEILTDEVNALLVEPDNTPAAAAAVQRLLGNHALAKRLSRAARATSSSHTWQARAKRLIACYRRWSGNKTQTPGTEP